MAEQVPELGGRCPGCAGSGKVDVILPGPERPTLIRGVVVDAANVRPFDTYHSFYDLVFHPTIALTVDALIGPDINLFFGWFFDPSHACTWQRYGGAWPRHTGTMNIVWADGHTKASRPFDSPAPTTRPPVSRRRKCMSDNREVGSLPI